MTVIAIVGAGAQRVVPRRGRFVCAPAVRVDSIVVQLIGFPRDQLVQTWSSSLSFRGMWIVLLSWHVARFGPR